MKTNLTAIFQSPVEMEQNGRVVRIVGLVFYSRSDGGVRELVVEDVAGNRWNAYDSELRPA